MHFATHCKNITYQVNPLGKVVMCFTKKQKFMMKTKMNRGAIPLRDVMLKVGRNNQGELEELRHVFTQPMLFEEECLNPLTWRL